MKTCKQSSPLTHSLIHPQMKEETMRISTLAIVILLFFSFALLLCHGNESTMRVLLEVKTSFTEDPENVLSDWSVNNTDYCSWRGVSCGSKSKPLDHDDSVVGLNLSELSLSGSISPSLGRLKNLIHLDLSSNRLSGPIPPTLSNLTSLESLLLHPNQLTGHIPTELTRNRPG